MVNLVILNIEEFDVILGNVVLNYFVKTITVGYVVSKEGVMVDLQKIEIVKNWTKLMGVIEIHSFVGLNSHYCQFVKGFAAICLHLECLTQKDIPFK